MYDATTRRQALTLMNQGGLTLSEISRRTGISRPTLKEWRERADRGESLYKRQNDCPRCGNTAALPEPADSYCYLLGLYLGDGCITPVGDPRKEVWALRIACANNWPGLIRECASALSAIRPNNKVLFVPAVGCTDVKSYSKHWPCFFPQHGTGKKHHRKIELAPWQETLVERFPEQLVRGLLHSDGSRFTNRVRRPSGGEERWYEYPRYNFTNKSLDIQRMFTDALDRLGIAWRQMNRWNVSVARREAVARLDEFVGPKY